MSPATWARREILLLAFEKNRRAPSTCKENTNVNHFIPSSSWESFMLSFKAIPRLKLNRPSMLSFGCRQSCRGNWVPSKANSPFQCSSQAAAAVAGDWRGGILETSSWVLVEHWQLLFADELALLQVRPLLCAWCGVRERVKQDKPHQSSREWMWLLGTNTTVHHPDWWLWHLSGSGLFLMVSQFHPQGRAMSCLGVILYLRPGGGLSGRSHGSFSLWK